MRITRPRVAVRIQRNPCAFSTKRVTPPFTLYNPIYKLTSHQQAQFGVILKGQQRDRLCVSTLAVWLDSKCKVWCSLSSRRGAGDGEARASVVAGCVYAEAWAAETAPAWDLGLHGAAQQGTPRYRTQRPNWKFQNCPGCSPRTLPTLRAY